MSAPVFMAQSAEGVLEFEKAYVPRKVRPPSLLKRLAALARMSPLPPQEAGVSMSGNEGFLEWARGFEPAQGFLLELSLRAAAGELRPHRVPRGARLRGRGRRRHPSHGAVLVRAVRRRPQRRTARGRPVTDRDRSSSPTRSTSTDRRSLRLPPDGAPPAHQLRPEPVQPPHADRRPVGRHRRPHQGVAHHPASRARWAPSSCPTCSPTRWPAARS